VILFIKSNLSSKLVLVITHLSKVVSVLSALISNSAISMCPSRCA
jgi:hypothetical protein